MGVLKEVVRSILIYYIVLTVIMSLVENSTYKKYIEMFTGLVLVLIIVNPIIRFLKVDNILDLQIQKNQLYEVTSQESQNLMVAELKQRETLIHEYKSRIEEEVSTQVKNYKLNPLEVSVEIDEDLESENFGSVEAIDIAYQKEMTEEKPKDYLVDEIEIPVVRIGNEKTVKEKKSNDIETNEVKIQIAGAFGISVEQVTMHQKEQEREE